MTRPATRSRVSAYPCGQVRLTRLVAIGSPEQAVLVDIDTTSPDIWINADCTKAGKLSDPTSLCSKALAYNPAHDSTTAVKLNAVEDLTVGPPGFNGNAVIQHYS